MTLIGTTANCLLRHSVQRCVKAVDEFVRMREITRSVKVTLKCLIAVVLVDVELPHWTSKVEHLVAFAAVVSNILLRMRRNGYLGTSGKSLGDLATFSADFLHFILSFDSPTQISLQSAILNLENCATPSLRWTGVTNKLVDGQLVDYTYDGRPRRAWMRKFVIRWSTVTF